MYVVSGDALLRDACAATEILHPLSSVDDFLQLFYAAHGAKLLVPQLRKQALEIIDRVAVEFVKLGFFVTNVGDGEVEDVETEEVALGPISIV